MKPQSVPPGSVVPMAQVLESVQVPSGAGLVLLEGGWLPLTARNTPSLAP